MDESTMGKKRYLMAAQQEVEDIPAMSKKHRAFAQYREEAQDDVHMDDAVDDPPFADLPDPDPVQSGPVVGDMVGREKNQRGETLWCFCRLPQGGRPMMGCDVCPEWYHMDCLGISIERSKSISSYVCQRCEIKRGVVHDVRRNRTCKAAGCNMLSRPHSRYCDDNCGIAHAQVLVEKRLKIQRLERQREKARKKNAKEARIKQTADLREAAAMAALEKRMLDATATRVEKAAAGPMPESVASFVQRVTGASVDDVPSRLQSDVRLLCELEADVAALSKERDLLERRAAVARCTWSVGIKALALRPAPAVAEATLSSIDCPVCGKVIKGRQMALHVQQCAGTEDQADIVTSLYRPRVAVTLFCDTYDPKTKTVCKKLKVSCPWHSVAAAQAKGSKDKEGGQQESAFCGYMSALNDDAALDALFAKMHDVDKDAGPRPSVPANPSAFSATAISARLDDRLDSLQTTLDPGRLSVVDLQPCKGPLGNCPQHGNWARVAEMRLLQDVIRLDALTAQAHEDLKTACERLTTRVKEKSPDVTTIVH